MGTAHARQQRHVEDAVAARVAVDQVDAVLLGPGAHSAQLARAPDEALVEPACVAAVLDLVPGGDEIVEADGLRERGDHVGGRGGGEDQPVPFSAERGETLWGKGGDDPAQGRDGTVPGGPDLLLLPAPGHPGGGPDQPHGDEVLAQAVVDGIEQLVAGQRPAFRQDPLVHEGTVEDLAGRPAQQGAVQVDEDGALRHR
jgi:hypothetical protein